MSQLNIMTKLVVAMLLGVGIVLVVGGAQLALLGGSLYYVASGVALTISSVWIRRLPWFTCSHLVVLPSGSWRQ